MSRNFRGKLHQENTRDRKDNLRYGRYYRRHGDIYLSKKMLNLKKKSWHKTSRKPGTLARSNLRIIGMNRERRRREESQVKGSENIFNRIIKKNFPNPKKEMPSKAQEANRTPNRLDQKRESLQHITVRTLIAQNIEY